MSQLVRLEGKHTTQNAHCALVVGKIAGRLFFLISSLWPCCQFKVGNCIAMHNVHFGYYVFLPTEQAETYLKMCVLIYQRCMKTGLHIIFQENYRSYEHALKQANLKTLRQRRILLMNNFAKKASKSERFNKWFVVESNEEGKSTRTKKPTRLLRQIPCRTQRYERSSLPYMTKLLSWHPPLPAPDLSMK